MFTYNLLLSPLSVLLNKITTKTKTWFSHHKNVLHSFQLRNGQSVCTDNECTDLVLPQNVTPGADSADNFTWMMIMMIAAVILYLIRPNSLRRRDGDLNKPSRDDVRINFLTSKDCFDWKDLLLATSSWSSTTNG